MSKIVKHKRYVWIEGKKRQSKEYTTWKNIKLRCYDPACLTYYAYGAMGVIMCDRWLESFDDFVDDMGYAPGPKYQIDRIDNLIGYFPTNCRWVTARENSNNRKSNVYYTYNGVKDTLANWCRAYNMTYDRVWQRMKKDNWSFEKALTTPERRHSLCKNS